MNGDKAPSRGDLRRAWLRGTVIAAASLLVGALLGGVWVAARYEARLGHLARETAELRARLGRVEKAAGSQVDAPFLTELLENPAVVVLTLRNPGAAPAHGRVLWSATAGGYLVAGMLPAPADGQSYVLWALTPSGPRRVATLDVDPAGMAQRRIPPAPLRIEGFTVTLESTAGSPAPAGPTVLASP